MLQILSVREAFLVCDRRGRDFSVLALIHTSMDIPARLVDLEPTLTLEVEVLHRKLQRARKNG